MMKLFRRLLAMAGYQLSPLNRNQVFPPEITDPNLYAGPEDFSLLFRPWRGTEFDHYFTREVIENSMLSRQKLYYLLRLLSQVFKLDGDVFEAGTGSGGSAFLMLKILANSKADKQMWLLDTFAGYQKVEPTLDGQHVKVHQCTCKSKEDVEKLLSGTKVTTHLIEGLIPATLEKVTCNSICFAHIDVNLYEPTFAATNFVLDRLTKGGIILFDDYCWPATFGARIAIDKACAHRHKNVIAVPESTQAFLINS